MSFLNDITILKPGMLAKTAINDMWKSAKYRRKDNTDWEAISPGTPILIVNVSEQGVVFLHQESLFFIYNCYNDEQGNPYWCKPIINE